LKRRTNNQCRLSVVKKNKLIYKYLIVEKQILYIQYLELKLFIKRLIHNIFYLHDLFKMNVM